MHRIGEVGVVWSMCSERHCPEIESDASLLPGQRVRTARAAIETQRLNAEIESLQGQLRRQQSEGDMTSAVESDSNLRHAVNRSEYTARLAEATAILALTLTLILPLV